MGTKRATYDNLDRLSNSPKEIIDEILKRLPIRDAIKTSFLSRGWRYRWMSMPVLVFDRRSDTFMRRNQVYGLESEQQINTKLVNFVNKVLLLHNTTLSKFELNNFLLGDCSDLDQWILVLSRKKLNNLILVFKPAYPNFNPYHVPGCLFSCQTLQTLELRNCVVKLPSQYEGFIALTSLYLFYVNLTNDTLETLVAKSSLLKRLRLVSCNDLTHIIIDAPNLEQVSIRGCCETISFRNALKVRVACIQILLPGFPMRFRLDQVLGGLNKVRHISIVQPFLEMDVAPRTYYHHLTFVQLAVNLKDSKQVIAVRYLCRSSPLLKTLEIKTILDHSAHLYETNFWEARLRKEADVFPCLKTVRLTGFKGVKHDMEFTHFILMNAVVLETFSIYWGDRALLEKLTAVEKMMQFEKASSKAKVIFNSKT
ncbi:F-box/FBD/LRR-repeat protein [Thalictrum thalictroides]|uniref:F-box/FBD/LRR-repeat protein n=1 Tax=Thalictrum thalictroides TaxID=46969 RepID=A0A7J6V6P8_THATH|nr:F-box/FBD/LRR-repeat protein [Thalictrum thalictroides]